MPIPGHGGDDPSNGVGVGKRGWDTASMLMSRRHDVRFIQGDQS